MGPASQLESRSLLAHHSRRAPRFCSGRVGTLGPHLPTVQSGATHAIGCRHMLAALMVKLRQKPNRQTDRATDR